jgi:NAD(P)-dependent dehydrogenase (short-subunit alcohol dehydrogenase family)
MRSRFPLRFEDHIMPISTLDNRTVLVTDGSDGIGYDTVRYLVAAGATVVLHAGDRQRGEDALQRLVKTGSEPLRLHLVVADLTRMSEVRALAEELSRSLPALDALVNNAAIDAPEHRTLTVDGHEVTFQVNYLAAAVITTALADRIVAAKGRVVNVSSAAHRGARVAWNDLSRKRLYTPLAAYAQAELALTMFTRTIAESGPLTAVAVDPGAGDAAAILAQLCAPNTPVVNGGYYEQRDPAVPAPLVSNPHARRRLHKITTRLLTVD